MKWTYWEANVPDGWAEMWQLNEDQETVVRGTNGKVYLVKYEDEDMWRVCLQKNRKLGELSPELSEEELKAMAITLWRMS